MEVNYMAFRARDGRAFGNRQRMRAYDERTGSAPTAGQDRDKDGDQQNGEPSEGPDRDPEREASPEGEDISHMDIDEAVRQHGPADRITIRHSGGRHEVTSMHDGRMHRSVHPDAMSAHIHAGDAAGLNPESGPGAAAQGAAPGASIPGIAG
jgi:hypothetical protein